MGGVNWLLGQAPSQGPCRLPRFGLSAAGGRQPKQGQALSEAFGDSGQLSVSS